jgi:N6-L-threonylcarbamoyladenine synthase
LVGVEIGRTISYAWNKPLIPVNHLEGHIYANLISDLLNPKHQTQNPKFEFPLLALLVSGGHTELVLMKDHLNYKIIGSTLDDAAGEAFDKSAKLMGLPYPGGPVLAKLASEGKRDAINFPRPMLDRPGFDFSFSGIKTSVAVYLKKHPRVRRKNVAASFEEAIVETLVVKTLRAIEKYKPKTVVLAGGVSANLYLRETLRRRVNEDCPGTEFLEPQLQYSTDNGAMIAAAGAVRYLQGFSTPWDKIKVDPNLPLK